MPQTDPNDARTELLGLLDDSTDLYVDPDIVEAAANGVTAQSQVTFGQQATNRGPTALIYGLADEPIG